MLCINIIYVFGVTVKFLLDIGAIKLYNAYLYRRDEGSYVKVVV